MDVELQILKHLPRDAHPTVAIIERIEKGHHRIEMYNQTSRFPNWQFQELQVCGKVRESFGF